MTTEEKVFNDPEQYKIFKETIKEVKTRVLEEFYKAQPYKELTREQVLENTESF